MVSFLIVFVCFCESKDMYIPSRKKRFFYILFEVGGFLYETRFFDYFLNFALQ